MLNYTKILCAFDFDEYSVVALHLAGKLARESKATLYIGHIAKVPIPDMDVPLPFDANPRWEREARAELATIAAQQLHGDVEYKIEIRSGLPDIDIVRLADELGVDLVVMATHGRSGFKHFVMGSVTEHVIREAPCPVLVIRPPLFQVAENPSAPKATK
jgi:universal stress protein A